MKLRALLSIPCLMLLAANCLQAHESAVLRNGFSISHDHHRQIGSVTRLFLTASENEFVDMPSENILGFEPDVDVPEPQIKNIPNALGKIQPALTRIVERAANENQLDPDFIHAVVRAESNGKSRAVSPKGAQGLMQLMPQTAIKLGVKNSFDPAENINAGTRYLRELLARYHNDPIRALAAYNAGAGRVEQYHGVPPYRETRAYVASIIRDFNRRKLEEERAAKSAKSTQTPLAKVSDGN
ncbi:MAG TPA: lytic transglycosylase domain-containing protein [Terriglobales bacterium]|nr:lytic transglycosylase domain-containing protein [Terriglobales bacterium]